MARKIKKWNTGKILKVTEEQLEENMNLALAYAVEQAQDKVSRGNADGTNPSSPGEPPKTVTGTLKSNIGYEVDVINGNIIGRYGVKKGPADEYAIYLELGTPKGKMKARPFLRPVLKENRYKLFKLLSREGK